MRFVNPIIFVRDVNTSKAFYRDLLGLSIDQDEGSFVRFEVGLALHEGSALEQTIWGRQAKKTDVYGQSNLLLYFEHDDIDAAFTRISPRVELIHPVKRQFWGQRVFRFYDPDRHTLEIGEPQSL
ncbi:MAG: VOC family protein [Geminicoccaceae bacterium]